MLTRENTKTIYDLTENAGRQHGERIFLRYEENDVVYEVSHRQFSDDCAAVRAWAKRKEMELGHPVKAGLLGSSGHHYLAVLLGVMGAGEVAVPLDIQLDVAALADNLTRSDVDVLFYDWEHHALVEGAVSRCPKVKEIISLQHGHHVSCTDQLLADYQGLDAHDRPAPADLAMVLFTSGTTGRGKGVMLSHGNLIDNVFCTTNPDHPENEVYLNILPIHHVFCINADVFVVLRYGCTLCLNREMSKLIDHMRLFEPTMIHMVPMIAKNLYNRITLLARQEPKTSIYEARDAVLGRRLKKIICGGGYLVPELAENYRRLGIAIAQGYGMSECSPTIASAESDRPDKSASVGKIVEGCHVRIVDGEIQVKSPSVMMGYYNDPEETAAVMTSDGWLKTGDMGSVDEEGFLYLTGRKKNLIILSNGENVAPEELERLFEDERLIEDILVYGEDDAVCAEVYPNYAFADAASITDIPGAVENIVKRYNEGLPAFKRIMRVQVREIPFEKTTSKKIKRTHFFDTKKAQAEHLAQIKAPETETEKYLYDTVSGILGHTRFGIDTDLYAAGLDSLGSVMLLTDLYNGRGVSLTLNDLMNHPTIEKLEEFIEGASAVSTVDYSIREEYPLTNLQIYFAYVMRGNTTANLPFFFKLDARVDLKHLKASIEALFEAHPELKCVIEMKDGGFKNLRDDARRVDIPILRQSDEEWAETKKGLLVPYLYQKGEPLYHIGIYETPQGNFLYFDIAHIMGDGMTMNILFEDLNRIYAGEKLPKENYTFYEYILDEKAREVNGSREQNIRYYQGLMEGLEIKKSILNRTDFHDLERGENASIRNRFESLSRQRMGSLCKKWSVTDNVVFLTAYNYCISIFGGEKDTISSSIHSGRTDSRWSRLAGPLFITYYMRYTNKPHEKVGELLKRIGSQIMSTMQCNISNLHADEMFFQFQGDILGINEIGGHPAELQKVQLDSIPFHLQVFSDARGYYYELRYWENRFDRAQLEIFMICMEAVIDAMFEEPSVRRLKSHLPETVYPVHFYIEAGRVNAAAGCELIPDVPAQERVKAYVFDETSRKQPFGGWGMLYIMDHPTAGYTDSITNPYGPGRLYQTGRTARILPDGSIDFIEQSGRTVMRESIRGRDFLNLYLTEQAANEFCGTDNAEAYVRYNEKNALALTLRVHVDEKADEEALREYIREQCGEVLVPEEIIWCE